MLPGMRRPRSRRARARGGEAEEDRISGLPTELLLRILARVSDSHAVARAADVSPRWRGLWALLPEFHLRSVNPGAVSAVLTRLKAARDAAALAAPPELISVVVCSAHAISTRLVDCWLRHAADLAPEKLDLIIIDSGSYYSCNRFIQLPCLDRTKSIMLNLRSFHLTPPSAGAGDFSALERLVVRESRFDAAALLPRCPRLRVLEVEPDVELNSPFTVDLPMLEELTVSMNHPAQFHIVAPMLKYMSVSTHIRDASVSAPNLEKFSLDCSRSLEKMELAGNMRRLQELKLFRLNLFNRGLLWIGDGVGRLLQQLPSLHVLRLDIAMVQAQVIASSDGWLQKLPETSILMLDLSACGHEFGAIVLRLLQMVENVEELKMFIDSPKETCYSGCLCHHPQSMTDLSLPLLKNVEFKGFSGAKSAVYVMELLFNSAKALEQMTVGLCKKDPTDDEVRKQRLFDIFNLHPTVKCKVLDV